MAARKKKSAAKAKPTPTSKGDLPAFPDGKFDARMAEVLDEAIKKIQVLTHELAVPIPPDISHDMAAALLGQKSEVAQRRAFEQGRVKGIIVTARRARAISFEQYQLLKGRVLLASKVAQGATDDPLASSTPSPRSGPDGDKPISSGSTG
jgi:hypothetical protein